MGGGAVLATWIRHRPRAELHGCLCWRALSGGLAVGAASILSAHVMCPKFRRLRCGDAWALYISCPLLSAFCFRTGSTTCCGMRRGQLALDVFHRHFSFAALFCADAGGAGNTALSDDAGQEVPTPPHDKAARLARIRPHLRGGRAFRETPFHFDFLTPDMRQRFGIADTDSVSNFEYAPAVRARIDSCGDELVLDCGAGNRPTTWPNIVNLEIVAYPSTDVLAANEDLPFEDNTFAMVVSCAVLEHLRDPFAAAREMVRVTRPGGIIYADIPFLQPFHGYPSHYYT